MSQLQGPDVLHGAEPSAWTHAKCLSTYAGVFFVTPLHKYLDVFLEDRGCEALGGERRSKQFLLGS